MQFEYHMRQVCNKASMKLSAFTRLARIIPFKKKKSIMHTFIKSQFSFCPLLLMFCSKELNKKINSIHRRALRSVYLDYKSSFEELLEKDKAVTIHQGNSII